MIMTKILHLDFQSTFVILHGLIQVTQVVLYIT